MQLTRAKEVRHRLRYLGYYFCYLHRTGSDRSDGYWLGSGRLSLIIWSVPTWLARALNFEERMVNEEAIINGVERAVRVAKMNTFR